MGTEFAYINNFCYLCSELMKKALAILLYVAMLIAMSLTSCNVKRVMTTRAEYYTCGDTVTVIQTRSVEEYDARNHNTQLKQ